MFFSGLPSEETLEYIFRGSYTREDALHFSGSLMVDAARILCHDLLFTTEHLLHNVNLEGIYDAYANGEEDYSFLSDARNDFSREGWACDVQANIWSKPGMPLEQRAILSCMPEARSVAQPDDSPHPLVQQYENSVHEFLEHLILLILLSGGQPDGELRICQGFVSELVSLRFANSVHATRNITVSYDSVVIAIPDNVAPLERFPRVRFLPKDVSTMMVMYLLHVRPFLAKVSPHHPAVNSNFLFPTAQGHWHTDSYTQLIPRESQLRLNKTLVLEDINDAHIRHIKETHPEMLTEVMLERLNLDSGSYAWSLGASEQLPSSEIFQQLRSQQFRTPSPTNTETSSMSVQIPDSSYFNMSAMASISPIRTSIPYWTPMSSPDIAPDSTIIPNYYSTTTPYQHYNFSASGQSSIVGSAPPSPVRTAKPPQYVEPQGSITRLAFIDGYPKQARKHTSNPKSVNKKKNKKNKSSKVVKNTQTKKSPISVKAAMGGARREGEHSDEDDDNASSTGSVKDTDMILENLGLTSSVLKSEVQDDEPHGDARLQAVPVAKGLRDPIKHTNRILSNLRLQNLVTK